MMKKKLMVSLLTVSLIAASFVPTYGAEFTSEPAEAAFSAGEELISEEPEALEEVHEVSEAESSAKLTKMKWIKKPSKRFLYSGLNTKPYEDNGKYIVSASAGQRNDAKVKLIYSDGTSEVLGFYDYNKEGKFVELLIHAPNENDLVPGKYKAYVSLGGKTDISVSTNVEVQDTSKLPLIKNKGSKTIPYLWENPWVRFKTGSSQGYQIESNVKGEELGISVKRKYVLEAQYMSNGGHVILQPNTEYFISISGVAPEKKYKKITYTVKPVKVDISKTAGIYANIDDFTVFCTGKPIKMGAELKRDGEPLKLGKDYTISYKNNVKIGNHATVIFKGKGDYTGIIKETFRIIPREVNLKSAKRTSDTSAKLTWKKVSGATGYMVYRTNGKKWVKVADVRATSFTDKSLKKGMGYRYRVRAYGKEGKKYIYGAYSSSKAV